MFFHAYGCVLFDNMFVVSKGNQNHKDKHIRVCFFLGGGFPKETTKTPIYVGYPTSKDKANGNGHISNIAGSPQKRIIVIHGWFAFGFPLTPTQTCEVAL